MSQTLSTRIPGQTKARTFYPTWKVIIRTPRATLDVTRAVVAIRTHKSIEEPAGTFQLVLKPFINMNDLQPSSATDIVRNGPLSNRVSLSDVVSPMDFVEIRFGRTPPKVGILNVLLPIPPDPNPPPIMRGFIDRIAPQEAAPSPNSGQQNIIITGRDYGKLFMIFRTFKTQGLKAELTGQIDNTIKELSDFVAGAAASDIGDPNIVFLGGKYQIIFHGSLTADVLMAQLLRRGIDKYIKNYLRSGTFPVPLTHKYLATNRIVSTDNTTFRLEISTLDLQTFEGNLWNVLTRFQQAPFNETFYIEGKAAPIFVFRPTPFRGTNRQIVPGQEPVSAPTSEVKLGNEDGTKEAERLLADLHYTNKDVVRRDVLRDDSEVVNYYEVIPVMFQANKESPDDNTFAVLSGGKNPRINPESIKKYGFRPLEIETGYFPEVYNKTKEELISRVFKTLPPGVAVDDILTGIGTYLCSILKDAYSNMDKFHKGTLQMIGNEEMRVGRWIYNEDEDEQFYVTAVDHTFTPYERFDTHVSVIRGDALIRKPPIELIEQEQPIAKAARALKDAFEGIIP